MLSKIAIITINEPSLESAKRLVEYLDGYEVDIYSKTEFNTYKRLDDILPKAWGEYDAIIAILAIGAVVRKIAPLLKDKESDPAVLVINLALNRIIPLLSGHLGGANELANVLTKRIPNAINFLTTATDQTDTLAFEMLAKEQGWRIENLKKLANISNRLLNKKEVKVATYPSIFEIIGNRDNLKLISFDQVDENSVVIAPFDTKELHFIPKLSIGIGCNRGTSKESIKEAFYQFLSSHNLKREDIELICSFEAKSDERGLLEFAKDEGLELKFFDKETLNSLEGEFSPSQATKFFNLKGVAEPSALKGSKFKELIFKKEVYFKTITISGAI